MPKAILFDLDGTLIDSRADIAAAANHALERAGRAKLSIEKISSMVGDGARMLIARAFDLPADAPELETSLHDFHVYYTQNPAVFASYLPGATEAMSALRESTLKLALATNKPRETTAALMHAMDMAKYFSAWTAGGDGPLKPAPDPLRRILAELAIDPKDAWMVGDGAQDIGAARAVGCTAIAVGGGFASRASVEAAKPDAWIDSLHELVPLVQAASK